MYLRLNQNRGLEPTIATHQRRFDRWMSVDGIFHGRWVKLFAGRVDDDVVTPASKEPEVFLCRVLREQVLGRPFLQLRKGSENSLDVSQSLVSYEEQLEQLV